jgi:hypothetical protein
MEIKNEETEQNAKFEQADRRLSDEKKKLELALKESEEKYKEFYENAIDPMYINSLHGIHPAILLKFHPCSLLQ